MNINTRHTKIAAALVIFVFGVGSAWLAFRSQQTRPPETSPGQPEIGEAERLESTEFHPVAQSDLGEVARELERSISQTFDELPSRQRLSKRRAALYATAVRERVGMYLQPDYEIYVTRVAEMTGVPPDELRDSDRVLDEKIWRGFARRYAEAEIAPEKVRIRPVFIDGVKVASARGGQTTFMKGGSLYAPRLDPKQDELDVYEAMIPIRAPVAREIRDGEAIGDEIETPVYLSLQFVWDEGREQWLPWRAGVYNPSTNKIALSPPWI